MTTATGSDPSSEAPELLCAAYRHDAHKLTGEPHESATDLIAGVRVNEPVPFGADGDAAALSRPRGDPRATVENHRRPARLSLVDGEPRLETATLPERCLEAAVDDLLVPNDPVALHAAWLTSTVAADLNESAYHPYTSLKYHTLLVAALLHNYAAGDEFADLHLVVDSPTRIVPHRTILATDRFALRIDADSRDRPSTPLGSRPWRSWGATWSRLPAHPLETDANRFDMVVDANLRRIGSWSTALAHLEDAAEAYR